MVSARSDTLATFQAKWLHAMGFAQSVHWATTHLESLRASLQPNQANRAAAVETVDGVKLTWTTQAKAAATIVLQAIMEDKNMAAADITTAHTAARAFAMMALWCLVTGHSASKKAFARLVEDEIAASSFLTPQQLHEQARPQPEEEPGAVENPDFDVGDLDFED